MILKAMYEKSGTYTRPLGILNCNKRLKIKAFVIKSIKRTLGKIMKNLLFLKAPIA
jgi:hypothetical protein